MFQGFKLQAFSASVSRVIVALSCLLAVATTSTASHAQRFVTTAKRPS
jgi:hypothetical protein